ncbi:MAG TPA: acyl--CoA ligase family protein [Bacteroidales bacterium]|nr:acyl--CoA ligase family protein [Bacteroidales bacterium]
MEESKSGPVWRTELSPLDFLHRSAFIFPEKIAIVHGDRTYTYRQFEERVHRLASALQKSGLVKDDKVAFLCPNTPAMLEAHYGAPLAGGVLVTINTRLNKEEIRYILEHSDSRFLFVDSEFHSLVSDLDLSDLTIVRVDDSGLEEDPYEQFLAGGSPEPLKNSVEHEDQPISINYTSGTTGKPKGVIFSHRSTYLNALGEVIETGLTLDTVYLWTLPLFHCNGWCFSWAVTAVGGTHVCLRKTDPGLIWALIQKEGVTHFNGAPTLHTMLVNHPGACRIDHPVTVTVAGAPPSPTLLEKLRSLNLRPIHVYGLTETYGPYTICEWHREWDEVSLEEQARLRARQGQAYLTADLVRVVDSYMKDVPRDGKTIGEVVMRGNNVMQGYYKQPEATAEVFRGGWFHSGDLAVWHPDGYIELRDRLKDIIISGGENISTIEVEQTVVRHPAVLECAVVAIPDEKWGERPKAFVTLKKGAYASEEEILVFCKEHMAHYKCPAAIEICDLPKTATGKIQKYILREKEWAMLGKRIN